MMRRLLLASIFSVGLLWPTMSVAQTWHYPGGEPDTSFHDGSTTSGYEPHNFNYGSAIDLPAGTVTQLGAFVDTNNTGTIDLKLGLYTSGGSLVVQASPLTIPNGNVKTWRTADVADTAISAGTYYVLGSGSSAQLRYGYDSSGNGVGGGTNYAASMATSVSLGAETGQRFGVRAEVAESGGGPVPAAGARLLIGVGP